jgi:serine/threonine protein kinase
MLLNNRYRIIYTLGRDNVSQTYLAEDTYIPSKTRCVIKQLRPYTNDPKVHQIIKERFQREAAVLDRLGRTNDQISKLYAYFTEENEFYLVHEFTEGKNLEQKVREEGVLNESSVKIILIDILTVLDFIHSKGVIHRDIKPRNIIVRDHDRKTVLINFGAIAEIVIATNSQEDSASKVVIGTSGFISPEQAAGLPIFASDIYSLGMTAIHLLTGKNPRMLNVTDELSLHHHLSSVSTNFVEIINKSIRLSAQNRYKTAREMIEALQPDISTDVRKESVINQPLKVFISYKWEDEAHNEWVRKLAMDLRSAGIEAFLDRWEVRLGDSFTDYMTSRITGADVVLFIMTTKSIAAAEAPKGEGGAVKFELQMATARRIAGEQMRLIPIYREGSKTAAHILDHRYADFRDDNRYEQNLKELIDDLCGQSTIPPLGSIGGELG